MDTTYVSLAAFAGDDNEQFTVTSWLPRSGDDPWMSTMAHLLPAPESIPARIADYRHNLI